ncbi:hypothetical protein ETAA8_39910 [Anatilimnocola aggregata]|uniref:Uncharacterized protein n=1 Tax=Anatilimnocola aggregata TaxID=2528021 RepID=A0A517YF70_9BACT|nr:hypothetical protein [Anatilimnocola aggregata]QDU28885.1 hypothetical protein ETAA8_39910 [Anatilimnocola aggregata]
MGQWVFDELRATAVRRQPNETELFKTEQTGEGEYAGNDALVREVLQNSIDAATGEGPVRVRLAIHEAVEAPVPVRLGHYFRRLREPLQKRQVNYNSHDYPVEPCRFLVCEDFATKGLEGNTLLFQDPPTGHPEYFYWFWRNIGRSGKTGVELGRWGLGKTVYRAASRVGCMFGLTVRSSDRRELLMGQAVSQIHRHEGKEFVPEGFWCSTQAADGLPLPIEQAEELAAFRREWKLTRRQEPGLSVVAPYIPAEIKAERLVQAVAVHFFTRIVRGELIVEVAGDGKTITLDAAGIESACRQIVWNGPRRTKRHVAPPISFARKCFHLPRLTPTEVLGKDRLPELSEAAFSAETLTQLRRQFSAGELVGVCVRFWLPKKVGGEQGACDVFVQRGLETERGDTYYVREGMTITKINSRAASKGIRGLLLVDRGPLAVLLGDTEGPAHEDWDSSAERPDLTWKVWKGRVKFVRGLVDSLVELLTPPNTEPDFDLLSDFFSVELPKGSQRKRSSGEDATESPKFEPPVVTPKWYRVTDRAGGFTVSRTPNVLLPEKGNLLLSVAYDLPRGDPLKNWSKFDFSLGEQSGELKPTGRGLKVTRVQGNQLLLHDFQANFTLAIDGFDRHRDLYVRIDEPPNDEPQGDAKPAETQA